MQRMLYPWDFIPKAAPVSNPCPPSPLLSGPEPSRQAIYHTLSTASRLTLPALHKNGGNVSVFNPQIVHQNEESVCRCPSLLFCPCVLSWLSSRAFDFHTSLGVSGLLFSLHLCLRRYVSNSAHNKRITTT